MGAIWSKNGYACHLVKPVVILCVVSMSSASSAYESSDNVKEVSLQGDTLTLSQLEKIERINEIKVDASTLWKTPYGDQYYIKAKRVDQGFIDSGAIPVEIISPEQLVSRNQQSAIRSTPAIADKMMQESTLASYSSFTGILRSLLSGRLPTHSVAGSDLFNRAHRNAWVASTEDEGVDYLGQDEDDDSYGAKIAEGARSVVNGPWFTVFQFHGHYFDQDPMEGLAGFKSSGYGLHGALMRPLGDNCLLGAYAGWQNLNGDMRHSDGEVEVGTWRLGPGIAWGYGVAHVEGLLTYSWSKVNNKVNGYSGEYKHNQWDTYLRGGFDIDMENITRGLSLTPELQLLYSSQNRDAFDWVYNERIKSAESKGWVTRVGGTLGYDRLQFEQPLELKLAAGWQYNQFITEGLETENGKSASLNQYDQHAMYYSAGIDARINEIFNLSLSYAGTWSSNALGHYLQAGVEFRF